jgi:copper(I)-binding protein
MGDYLGANAGLYFLELLVPPPQVSRPTGTAESATTKEGHQALTGWHLPATVVWLKEIGPESLNRHAILRGHINLKGISLYYLTGFAPAAAVAMLGFLWCLAPATIAAPVINGAIPEKSHGVSSPSRVRITGVWARATVPGQAVGVAYLTIASAVPVALVRVETDAAKQVQLHNMRMNQGVMEMREHKELKIAANEVLALAPGGMHLMLLGLKKPLKAGEKIFLAFTFVDKTHTEVTSTIDVPIRPIGHE